MSSESLHKESWANAEFAELAASSKPVATRICRKYRIPPQDAEDLMQQCLLAFIDSRSQIENPESWLAGTMRNHCLMYWRRRRRRLYRAVDTAILEALAEPTPSEQPAIDFSHDMANVLSQIPPRCRQVLELRYGLGYQPVETAQRLGYRSSSIYKVLNRCLAALSRTLTACGLVTPPTARSKRADSVPAAAS